MYKVFENDKPPVVITFKSIVITKHLNKTNKSFYREKKKPKQIKFLKKHESK